ncbi:MAG: AAA family ATPase [Anaerolineae bacterium]
MTKRYHFKNIRTLFTEAFAPDELRNLCFDVFDFRPVYHQLAANESKTRIVSLLLEYADQTLQIEKLLALAEEHNPTRFQKHQPYFEEPTPTSSSQKIVRNPYITGNAVTGSNFYGREGLIKTILGGSDANFWIIGNRRVGKTSLLRELERRTANSQRYLPLFWDMSAGRTEEEFVEKLNYWLEVAQQENPDNRWASFTPSATNKLRQALHHLAGWVNRQNLCLLLLCDEAEALIDLAKNNFTVLQELRDILLNRAAIRPVLVSTRRLSHLHQQTQEWSTSAFLDGFASYPLLNFRDETASQVIKQAQSATPLSVEESLLTGIRRATGNHPFLLQKLCSQLFDETQESLRPLLPSDFDSDPQITLGFLYLDFNALTPDEASLLQYIHISPCTLTQLENQFTQLKLKLPLYNLIQLGFVQEERDRYHIGNLFLASWLDTLPSHHTPQGGITNKMMREVTLERKNSLYRLLGIRYQALNHLREQAAKFGLVVPTYIQFEIDEHLSAIAAIETELAELGENITPFHSPPAA